MLKSLKNLAILLLLACFPASSVYAAAAPATPLLAAYYTNWSQYRIQPANFTPENLKPIASRLNVINYAFLFFNYQSAVHPAGVTSDWQVHFTEWNDDEMLKKVVSIAKKNNAKVYASIGGWNFNDPSSSYGFITNTFFSQMVGDPNKYLSFIDSSIALCVKYGLAGIDLDWEYPGVASHGGGSADYQNFADFLQIFSQRLKAKGLKLTAAVTALTPNGYTSGSCSILSPSTKKSYSYKITTDDPQTYIDWMSGLSEYFDYFNVMCYDYHGAWPGETVTGEDAPLYPVGKGSPSVSSSINSYLHNIQHPEQSTPASKIIVGIPTYGRTFSAVNFPSKLLPDQPYGPGATFGWAGSPGIYTNQAGVLAFYEIMQNLKESYYDGTQTNPVTGTAYAWGTKQKTWVSYDTPSTANAKGQYILSNKLGGGMIYALDFDNFYDQNSQYTITNNLANGMGAK